MPGISQNMEQVTIDNKKRITTKEVTEAARGKKVVVDDAVYSMLAERRNQIKSHIREKKIQAYGFNRGFGHNVDLPVDDYRLYDTLQKNLILSHACGTGYPANREIVRATMFLRAVSLSRGYSGIRPEVIQTLVDMLNADVIPEVPVYGSVGASGDLAPLSHIALTMMGKGFAFFKDENNRIPADQALKKAKIAPLNLKMKEGLALNNGVQFSTALAILSCKRLTTLLKTATITTALTAQVMLGADTPFRKDLHQLRPHPGALEVSGWIFDLMKNSPLRNAHEPYEIDGEIQDPYNIRCAAQILGTCHDLIEEARNTFEIEANSVTDNPVILPEKNSPDRYTEVVSGGHFHGMPVSVKLYNLMQAMGIMSRLSNMRCARYVDPARNKGLGSDLLWPGLSRPERGVNSGMMIPEYVTASLTNHIWAACMPSHLFSLSTDAGQEDHVSMAPNLGVRVWETIPRLAEILAIELAMGAQASAIRKESGHIPSKIKLSEEEQQQTKEAFEQYENRLRETLKERVLQNQEEDFDVDIEVRLKHPVSRDMLSLSPPCRKLVQRVQRIFPVLKTDRWMGEELNRLAVFVLEGEAVRIVEGQIDWEKDE